MFCFWQKILTLYIQMLYKTRKYCLLILIHDSYYNNCKVLIFTDFKMWPIHGVFDWLIHWGVWLADTRGVGLADTLGVWLADTLGCLIGWYTGVFDWLIHGVFDWLIHRPRCVWLAARQIIGNLYEQDSDGNRSENHNRLY